MREGLRCRPLGISGRQATVPGALALAGGPLAFCACEVVRRPEPGKIVRISVSAAEFMERAISERWTSATEAWDLLDRLSAPRPAFAGLPTGRPQIIGVLNVTPDSFSDGGDRFDSGRAVADGLAMREAGAAILDVGGESTRPGAEPVPIEEEMRRVIPVVRRLAEAGALVSVDTRRATVMRAAIEAGAKVINDVTALSGDPLSLRVAAESGLAVVLMHMQGEPRTMQADPRYEDAPLEVYDWLEARVLACEEAGIPRARIAVDPGIGFGKALTHNLQILEQLALLHGLGCPIVLGVSRKSFIGRLSRDEPPKARVPGSLAALLAGLERGAQIVRVHDVPESVQASEVWRAIATAAPESDPAPVQASDEGPAAASG